MSSRRQGTGSSIDRACWAVGVDAWLSFSRYVSSVPTHPTRTQLRREHNSRVTFPSPEKKEKKEKTFHSSAATRTTGGRTNATVFFLVSKTSQMGACSRDNSRVAHRITMVEWVEDVFPNATSVQPHEPPEDYRPGGFHPVALGDTFQDGRFVVRHKLGFGGQATVWLARDTRHRYNQPQGGPY